jgi:hypothetical protein
MEEKVMFYKVLFILTAVKFIRDIIRYAKEIKLNTSTMNGVINDDVPVGTYLKIGISALFYIMVLTLTLRPHLFWW